MSKILPFKDFYDTELISEGVTIEDGKLKFDYGTKEGLLNKMGKNKTKKSNFVPFESNKNELGEYKILSVYKTKGVGDSTEIVKALKKQSHVTVNDLDYFEFIKRTAIFIAYRILAVQKADVLVTPKSSTNILNDIVDEIRHILPHIKIVSEAYVKPTDTSKITVDENNPLVTDEIRANLNKELKRAMKDGGFKMKKIKNEWRKFIKGFLDPREDLRLKDFIGSNVAVLDDLRSSGTTLTAMIDNIKMIKDEAADDNMNVFGITIFTTK